MENVPDLSRFAKVLLEPNELVELVPHKLVDDDHTALLVPARGRHLLNADILDESTLPRINLKDAGIDTNQRGENILREVRSLLRDRLFVIVPHFDVLKIIMVLPLIARAVDCHEIQLKLKENYWLREKTKIEDEKGKLDEFVKKYSAPFSLSIKGGNINGLDTTRTIYGYIPQVLAFIIPKQSYENDATKLELISAACQFFYVEQDFKNSAKAYEEYLKSNGTKMLFRFFNRIEEYEKKIENSRLALARARTELIDLLTAWNNTSASHVAP